MKKVDTMIELKYQETDQIGIVYHVNYLVTKFIESLKFKYADMEIHHVVSPVANVNIAYKCQVTYSGHIYVEPWIEAYNRIKTVYGYYIRNRNKTVTVTGTREQVIVKKGIFRPLSFKKTFLDWQQTYVMQINGVA